MVQRPLKKMKLQKNVTKYKRALKVRNQNELITREINKGIVEKYESVYGRKKRKNV